MQQIGGKELKDSREEKKPATQAARIREERGETQTQVAARAGISASHLSLIETGEIQNPHIKTLRSLAAALEVSLEELLDVETTAA